MVSSDCHWLSPACSGEIITTVSFWTAAFAAGGGSRWSQSDRSKVPGSIRSKPCIRDLQTQSVTHRDSSWTINTSIWWELVTWPVLGVRSAGTAHQGWWAHSCVHQNMKPYQENVSVLWQVDEDNRSMQNPQLKDYSFYFLYALLVLIIVCQFVAETINWTI